MGYPTDSKQLVNSPVANGMGHTTTVDGACLNCGGIELRNIQVSTFTFCFDLVSSSFFKTTGTRAGARRNSGRPNIVIGSSNLDQLIEYVHSYDPRDWSCLYITGGSLNCPPDKSDCWKGRFWDHDSEHDAR
ncbi:hypothetical protein EDB84DRAFT_967825 [Lactarius hengduanensis]|nr:hypothetical protein EDB84DRAFT_967825 [Lactarius hengduanensis]